LKSVKRQKLKGLKELKMEVKEILKQELELITPKEWVKEFNQNPEVLKMIQDYRIKILDRLINLEKNQL
jgi:hypothetical protein